MIAGKLGVLGLALVLALACNLQVQASDKARIFISLEDRGQIAVIDPSAEQVITNIPVGKRPRGIKLSRDGKVLYVALSGSPVAGPGVDESKLPPPDRTADGIGVVDLSTYKLMRILSSGQDPETFDISQDGTRLYVSNEETAEITVLNITTGAILKRIAIGKEPEGVTVRPDGKFIYVACEGDNEVVAIDAASLKVVSRMHTGLRPRSIAFSIDGSTAFVTAERSGSITVLDSLRHRTTTEIEIPSSSEKSPARPMGSVLSPDGNYLFVSTGRGESVAIIKMSNRKVFRSIKDVGSRPWGIDVSSDGKYIYTANGPSNDVSIIEADTGRIKNRVKVGGRPWGLVVAQSSR
jgi:YVTN family beta-propeller protein